MTIYSAITDKALNLRRPIKRLVVLVLDVSIGVISVLLAFYFRLGDFDFLRPESGWSPWLASIFCIFISLPIFISTGFYRAIFRYSEWNALKIIFKGILIYSCIFISFFSIISFSGVPRTIGFIQPVLFLVLIGGSRAFAGYMLGGRYRKILGLDASSRVLIYGAGEYGQQVSVSLQANNEICILGFIDDDIRMIGGTVQGLPIYSSKNIPELIKQLAITEILLAIPSSSRAQRNQILRNLDHLHVAVRTLPSLADIAKGTVSITQIQELDLDDLLGRESVPPDPKLLSQNIFKKTVLVTGAGGSIGSELCLKILVQSPKILLLVEHSEFALYQIFEELQLQQNASENKVTKIIPLLASVRDEPRMRQIISCWRPESVYHTAAYKHVPLVEHNSFEGVENNVFGTFNLARLSLEFNVQNFLLISTDKAVRPTNIMGASKRIAEIILLALKDKEPQANTKFSMVRFGNVLGSSGSVIPKFREQISAGGPVTLTHPDVTRYFMTIAEASQLVLQAGAMAKGGEVFLLDMGNPVRIKDLVYRMIELSGFIPKDESRPDGDIEIIITGLRPGEKLFEELLIEGTPQCTSHPKILQSIDKTVSWKNFSNDLSLLEKIIDEKDHGALEQFLTRIVEGYIPHAEIVDWVYAEVNLE